VGIDRESAVRKAEELVREGKIGLAVEEYARLVEDQPADFGAANALGDLYAKMGNRAAAAAQFVQIGDQHRDSGFVPKAVAFYKKALKADPASDHALSQLAQIAVEQELYADATLYLNRLIQMRRERNHDAGVAECLVRLGGFPAATADTKMAAARASASHYTPDQTTRLWLDAADALERAGRPREAVDVLMQASSLAPDDVTLRRRVAEACAATGQLERVRAFLSFETAGDHPDLLLALADHALADGRDEDARRALERVMAVAPDRRVEAETMLAPLTRDADAPPAEAELAPDVVPDAASGVHVVDVDGPVDVNAAFAAGADESAADDVAEYGEVTIAAAPPEPEPESALPSGSRELEWSAVLGDSPASEPEPEPEPQPENEPELIVAEEPELVIASEPEPVPVAEPELVNVVEPEPVAVTEPEPVPEPEVVPELVLATSPEPAQPEASQEDLDSITALTAAAQNPVLQFQASAQLGRLLVRLGRLREGIEWLERATQAATTARDQRLGVVYEYADALERAGERARALDVFADLDFDAASYRDVPERIAALRRALGEEPAT
jgi:tetratricopeptide (TPR) repeat protein